jgi:hypothetical protein
LVASSCNGWFPSLPLLSLQLHCRPRGCPRCGQAPGNRRTVRKTTVCRGRGGVQVGGFRICRGARLPRGSGAGGGGRGRGCACTQLSVQCAPVPCAPHPFSFVARSRWTTSPWTVFPSASRSRWWPRGTTARPAPLPKPLRWDTHTHFCKFPHLCGVRGARPFAFATGAFKELSASLCVLARAHTHTHTHTLTHTHTHTHHRLLQLAAADGLVMRMLKSTGAIPIVRTNVPQLLMLPGESVVCAGG